MGSKLGRLFTRAAGSSTPSNRSRPPAQAPKLKIDPSVHEPSSGLLHRLKDVYVESTTDIVTHENPYGSDRQKKKLPQDRRFVDEDSFNTGGPPEGYVTYQQVLEALDRCKDSDQWPIGKLASQYKLDKTDLNDLVTYFSSYRVVGKTDNNGPRMEFHSLIA